MKTNTEISSLRAELRSSLWLEVTSNMKCEFCNSVSEATSKKFYKIHSKRGLRKFNRFCNRIVVWIWDFQKKYSSTFLLPLQWVLFQCKDKYSPWNLSWPCCFNNPVKVLLTTARPYGDLVVLSKYREGVLYLERPASSNPLSPVRGT